MKAADGPDEPDVRPADPETRLAAGFLALAGLVVVVLRRPAASVTVPVSGQRRRPGGEGAAKPPRHRLSRRRFAALASPI